VSDWARKSDVPASDIPFRATDSAAHVLAIRLGLGMALLSRFVADADPSLVRAPGTTLRLFGTLWVLMHGETRKTKRVRLFTEFISRRLAAHSQLLAGLTYSRD
jgi:DNA-binding transcriptional LysR family regulator